jgi:hypothetical protein
LSNEERDKVAAADLLNDERVQQLHLGGGL